MIISNQKKTPTDIIFISGDACNSILADKSGIWFDSIQSLHRLPQWHWMCYFTVLQTFLKFVPFVEVINPMRLYHSIDLSQISWDNWRLLFWVIFLFSHCGNQKWTPQMLTSVKMISLNESLIEKADDHKCDDVPLLCQCVWVFLFFSVSFLKSNCPFKWECKFLGVALNKSIVCCADNNRNKNVEQNVNEMEMFKNWNGSVIQYDIDNDRPIWKGKIAAENKADKTNKNN